MGVYTDPFKSYVSTNTWQGSGQDDTLVYGNGSDVIIGGDGYDVLVIPFRKSDTIIGVYQNNSVSFSFRYRYLESIDPNAGYATINVSAVGIEQLQFSDEVVTLVERQVAQASATNATSNQVTIPWGKSGRWVKTNFGRRMGWQQRTRRKITEWHVDGDVQVYNGEDIGTSPLALSGGSWANTRTTQDGPFGVVLYSGNNVIAYFQNWNLDQFNAASKIQ